MAVSLTDAVINSNDPQQKRDQNYRRHMDDEWLGVSYRLLRLALRVIGQGDG
jgi:hypothetical protein